MSGGEEWVLRPAIRGMCLYESLADGTLSLSDVAVMNEALDVLDENERIHRRWRREHPGAE